MKRTITVGKQQFPNTPQGRLAAAKVTATFYSDKNWRQHRFRLTYPRHDREWRRHGLGLFVDAYPTGELADLMELRLVGKSHEIVQTLRYTGWYNSPFDDPDDLLIGIVYQLPGRKGQCQYLAGVFESTCPCVSLDCDTIYDDSRDAALAADESARVLAEQNRDYAIEEDTRQHVDELNDELRELDEEKAQLLSVYPRTDTEIAAIEEIESQEQKHLKEIDKHQTNPWHRYSR